jgi:hypothetical protein
MVMPKLQIDGETIAEIDQPTADMLLRAANRGVGKVRALAGFQGKVISGMRKPDPPLVTHIINVDFPLPV